MSTCEQCDSVSNLAEYWWIQHKNEKWTLCEECGIAEEQEKCKENECVRCGCYNLSEFKKVERKHIHCLDCYRQVRKEKKRENRKQKREELICECCGATDDSVGLATGDNGVEMRVCRFCDVDGSDYNGWGDEEDCYAEPEPNWRGDILYNLYYLKLN
jgi:hypothetical protein